MGGVDMFGKRKHRNKKREWLKVFKDVYPHALDIQSDSPDIDIVDELVTEGHIQRIGATSYILRDQSPMNK